MKKFVSWLALFFVLGLGLKLNSSKNISPTPFSSLIAQAAEDDEAESATNANNSEEEINFEETTTYQLCERLDPVNQQKCKDCAKSGENMWTAIGCLPTDTQGLVAVIVRFLMGLAGLFFVIQIIIGGAQIIFANGDSGAVSKARSRITNSIIAILFIIFAVTILQIIGVQILRLPGFFGG